MINYQCNLENITPDALEGFFVGWKAPYTKEKHYQVLKNSQYIVLAIKNNKVIGFINALSDQVSHAFIPLLEVIPEEQNQGIGTKLMEIMLEQLNDITNIDLICDQEMQNFYQRFKMFKSHGMIIRKYLKKESSN